MSKYAANRPGKRATARLSALRRKAAEWRRHARRAVTLALITAGAASVPSLASAQFGGMGGMGPMGQMGQLPMAPTGGAVNRAVSGFQALSANGPGWMYYGVNGADRGLGYIGSYMTVGGFIPYSEDTMGGLWAADLRGHLSVNGGFFSNVGLVRKQFLGGTLLGVGLYWDYDGDMNQYPVFGVPGTSAFGQFGHTYNQIGVSGEWLTDYGNLRSNGYMPVGTTGYTAGSPGAPFYQNFIMCQNGLDAALSGADLEVGAYIPGLNDYAGMISVGGYALGNTQFNYMSGGLAGQNIVPYFGGVYTRLDMTFLNNWDFSLQANNDSFFDWTGFARLTYRMGGSRRRNVPDQMEQPMMRNEHIVRAHQTPVMATNPNAGPPMAGGGSGSNPWRVIHVNNAAPAGGNGTFERPFNTLADGNAAATRPWDIVFVDRGTGTAAGYGTEFYFLAENQFLVGNGAPFYVATGCCGFKNIATDLSGDLPVLSNPTGPSITIDGASGPGAVVANFNITGSKIGILGTGDLSSGLPRKGPSNPTSYQSSNGDSVVQNVAIANGGTGVWLDGGTGGQPGTSKLDGHIFFYDTSIIDTTQYGIAVTGPSEPGAAFPSLQGFSVEYNGSISTQNAEQVVLVSGLTGTYNDPTTPYNGVDIAYGAAPAGSTIPNEVTATGGGGIKIENNSADSRIAIGNVTLADTVGNAIDVLDDNSTTLIAQQSGAGITRSAAGSAVFINGDTSGSGLATNPQFTYQGTIQNARESGSIAPSYLLNAINLGGTANVNLLAPSGSPFQDSGDGILIQNVATGGRVNVVNAEIASVGSHGILINKSSGTLTFNNVEITSGVLAGVGIFEAQAGLNATFTDLNVNLGSSPNASGILATTSLATPYLLTVNGTSTVSTSSTTAPAISIEANTFLGAPTLNMAFASIASKVAINTNSAIILGTNPTGTLSASSFFVSGAPGTLAGDVTNPSATIVTVP